MKQLLVVVLLLSMLLVYTGSQVQPAGASGETPTPDPGSEPFSQRQTAFQATSVLLPDGSPLQDAPLTLVPAGTMPDPSAPNATFTVSSDQDLPDTSAGDGQCAASNGQCTLRAAIQEANALSGADQVNLPGTVFKVGSELQVTGPITLKGAGQTSTVIDGNSATRVFKFPLHSGPHFLSDLTIQNGANKNTTEPERNGGGIFNNTNLSLTNITIKNSKAFQGGGIYSQYFWSENPPFVLKMTNVTITGNASTSTEDYWGGGGLFNGSAIVADGLYITNNTANLQGGGFLNNSQTTVSIKNFVISGNRAPYGAGIDDDIGVDIRLENGKISDNYAPCCGSVAQGAPTGGGIYHNWGTLTMVNVNVSGNVIDHPKGYGGGLLSIENMNLTNVSITGNQAAVGAGIFNGNSIGRPNLLNMVNVTVGKNTGKLTSGYTAEGGGIYNYGAGQITITNATITQNSSQITGGLRNKGAGVTMVNTILADNIDSVKAPDCSGAITSQGNNIIGDADGFPKGQQPCMISLQSSDITFVTSGVGAFVSTTSLPYFSLNSNSLPVDKGSTSLCPTYDQVGNTRPSGAACDVGAIEYVSRPIVYRYSVYLPAVLK